MANVENAIDKESRLRLWMQSQGELLVAYSGGVDSSYLALIATKELGTKALCVTGVSPSVSAYQLSNAVRIAVANDFAHEKLKTNEIDDENYIANSGDRCYFCKSELYKKITSFRDEFYPAAAIADGTNADDLGGHRPGREAARELGINSPLVDFEFTKQEIREMSRFHGLETWDVPASPCLASRVAVGVPVTIERLGRVERGEEVLRKAGFREFRLRVQERTGRIEIAAEEMDHDGFIDRIKKAGEQIKAVGFESVTLNLAGFQSGAFSSRRLLADEDSVIQL